MMWLGTGFVALVGLLTLILVRRHRNRQRREFRERQYFKRLGTEGKLN